jgi:hypothetical protein
MVNVTGERPEAENEMDFDLDALPLLASEATATIWSPDAAG